jgi:hypothetical protein
MASIELSSEQATQLVELLRVVAAAPDTSDDDRYQLHYCHTQVGQRMPTIEVLVLAGVLQDATDRPELSVALRAACASRSADLACRLRVAPHRDQPTTTVADRPRSVGPAGRLATSIPWAR